MGSVQGWYTCPKCGQDNVYSSDYYYKSGEEYCHCLYCGAYHNVFLLVDEETGKMIFKPKYHLPLAKGKVYFGVEPRESKGKIQVAPVLESDTTEVINNFCNMAWLNAEEREELAKDARLAPLMIQRGHVNIFLSKKNGYEPLSLLNTELEIKDGYLDVSECPYMCEQGGGFGIVTKETGHGYTSYSLAKGEVPEITDDVIFASAIIDGKLTVLKQPDVDDGDK